MSRFTCLDLPFLTHTSNNCSTLFIYLSICSFFIYLFVHFFIYLFIYFYYYLFIYFYYFFLFFGGGGGGVIVILVIFLLLYFTDLFSRNSPGTAFDSALFPAH